MLRLGYKASAEQFGPQDLLRFAVEAEQAGFDSVVVSDHFQPWRDTDGHAPNCIAWLGAVANATNRVAIGTSVLTPTFRYNPAIVAQAFATIALIASGRDIILGVGTGESLNEVVVGVTWPDQKERFARLKESVDLIRRLWREERVSYDGQFYCVSNATIYDRPEVPPKLYIAASGPAASRLAGRVADGFICTSGKGLDLYADTLLPAVQEGAAKADRSYDSIEKMIEVKVAFDSDRDQAMADTRIWSALALPAEAKMGVHDPREMERLAETVADQAHRRWLVSDDPDEHVAQIRPYLELGFTHLVFHSPGDDQSRFIGQYAEQVLPRLRQLG